MRHRHQFQALIARRQRAAIRFADAQIGLGQGARLEAGDQRGALGHGHLRVAHGLALAVQFPGAELRAHAQAGADPVGAGLLAQGVFDDGAGVERLHTRRFDIAAVGPGDAEVALVEGRFRDEEGLGKGRVQGHRLTGLGAKVLGAR